MFGELRHHEIDDETSQRPSPKQATDAIQVYE
jgi:hypothetical protein